MNGLDSQKPTLSYSSSDLGTGCVIVLCTTCSQQMKTILLIFDLPCEGIICLSLLPARYIPLFFCLWCETMSHGHTPSFLYLTESSHWGGGGQGERGWERIYIFSLQHKLAWNLQFHCLCGLWSGPRVRPWRSNALQRDRSCASPSSLAVSKVCATSNCCAYCLHLVTLNRALVSSLGGTYLSFYLGFIVWP